MNIPRPDVPAAVPAAGVPADLMPTSAAGRAAPGTSRPMSPERVLRAYLAETWYEVRRMSRAPIFLIPILVLPILLFLLFGVVIGGSMGSGMPSSASAPASQWASFAINMANMQLMRRIPCRCSRAACPNWFGCMATGVRPTAVCSGWAASPCVATVAASRRADTPQLLPTASNDCAWVLGFLSELCAEGGLGWHRRILMIERLLTQESFSERERTIGRYLAVKYGHSGASLASRIPPALRSDRGRLRCHASHR